MPLVFLKHVAVCLDAHHIATTVVSFGRDPIRRAAVLSDAEAILMFESDGATGRVEEQGYFATSRSPIARHVIDVLDGGTKALEMRSIKYGIGTRFS